MAAPHITEACTRLDKTGQFGIGDHKMRTWFFDEPRGISSTYLYDPQTYIDLNDTYELAETVARLGYTNVLIKLVGSDEFFKVHVGELNTAEALNYSADIVLTSQGTVLNAPDEIRELLPIRAENTPYFSPGYLAYADQGDEGLQAFRKEKAWREHPYNVNKHQCN